MYSFNHYKKKFPIINGVLKWSDIDDEYCLSFVYKGNFRRELCRVIDTDFTTSDIKYELRDEKGNYFINLNKEET